MYAGAHAVQGILACLVRRGVTGRGGYVQITMLESILDFQFEVLTTYLNDGGQLPQRSAINNAHAYLAAPYGIYETADGYLALSMQSITRLGALVGCEALTTYTNPKTWFSERDTIKRILADHLRPHTTAHWLAILEPADVWCAAVLNWNELVAHDGFQVLNMVQTVARPNGVEMQTTRCPIRIDGELLTSPLGAPTIGEHTRLIEEDFGLRIHEEAHPRRDSSETLTT
jgi:crotonobetainyl-CoA:carnitine CoA-transferase CaiB-like acyl-CoA transferase